MNVDEFVDKLNACSHSDTFCAYQALVELTDCTQEEFLLYLTQGNKKGVALQEFYTYTGEVYAFDWSNAVYPFIDFYTKVFSPSFTATECYIQIEVRRKYLNR